MLTFDKAHRRALFRHAPRRGSAGRTCSCTPRSADTICGAEYGHPCTRFCPANVYEIMRRRRRHAAPADQRVELRPLQDVRHHGSVPGDHLGPARRRRRAAVRRHVSDHRAEHWRAVAARKRAARSRPSARSAIRSSTRSATTWRWRVDGLQHLDAIVAAGRQPIMAFWHGRILPATLLLPPPRHRRHHERELRRRVDRAHHPALRLRHRPRLDIAATRARAALKAKRRMEAGQAVGFTVDGPRGPARVAQPGAVWLAKATGNPVLPFHLEASSHWTAQSWDAHRFRSRSAPSRW